MKKLFGFCHSCKYRLTAVALEEQNQQNSFHNNFAQTLFGYLNRDQAAFIAFFLKHRGSLSSLITELPLSLEQATEQLDQVLETLGLTDQPLFPEKTSEKEDIKDKISLSTPIQSDKTEQNPEFSTKKETSFKPMDSSSSHSRPTFVSNTTSAPKSNAIQEESAESSTEEDFLFPLDKPLDKKALQEFLEKKQKNLPPLDPQPVPPSPSVVMDSVPQFMPKKHHQNTASSYSSPISKPPIHQTEKQDSKATVTVHQPELATAPKQESVAVQPAQFPVHQPEPAPAPKQEPVAVQPAQFPVHQPEPAPAPKQESVAIQPAQFPVHQPEPAPTPKQEPVAIQPAQFPVHQPEPAPTPKQEPTSTIEHTDYTPVRQPVLRHILQQSNEPSPQKTEAQNLLTSLLKRQDRFEMITEEEHDEIKNTENNLAIANSALSASEKIKKKLEQNGGTATVLSITGKPYKISVRIDGNGFTCNKLNIIEGYDFQVFDIIVDFLKQHNGKAEKGNAKGAKYGDPKCDENTIVGIVAKEYAGAKKGDSVYDPVFVLAAILEWAEIAKNGRGYLQLLP